MTKSDKYRQLNTKQKNAIDLIIAGKNDSDVADLVGVTRQTVNEWRNHNSVFVAELNSCRQEIWGNQVDRLRSLIDNAIDVLVEEIQCDDLKLRHSAAVTIFRVVGLFNEKLYPEGNTDPAVVEMEWENQSRRRLLETLVLDFQTPDGEERNGISEL